jgi:chemotaxis response regulator CheB
MPGAAIEEGAADRVLPLGQIAAAVVEFVQA